MGRCWVPKQSQQKLLKKFLADGTIPLNDRVMGSKDVYYFDPEFASFPYEPYFVDHLTRLLSEARRGDKTGKSDHAAMIQDRAHYPCQPRNAAGALRWEGSEAEEMMELDVCKYLDDGMTPFEIYHSREV